MNIVEDFLDNPKRSIGGAVIPIIGVPGCGKTNVLIQLGLMRKQEGHKILWRGTEQGEWLKFLANGEKVCVWNHETVDRVRVKKSDENGTTYLNPEQVPNLETKSFSSPEELVNESRQDTINVVNIPGVFGEGKEGRAFFTEKIIDILEQVIRRENTYKFVDFFTDEAGDIWPCQQQLSGDQYNQVAERTPPLLSQLRKQNSFLYAAAHGTQDMHYFLWKIKANTICYMSNAKVKNFHSEISQKSVNRLERGKMWVPPKELTSYALAYEEEDLDWVDEGEHLDLEIVDSLDEYLETEEEVQVESVDQIPDKFKLELKKSQKKEYAEYMADELDMSYSEITEPDFMPNSKSTISNWISA